MKIILKDTVKSDMIKTFHTRLNRLVYSLIQKFRIHTENSKNGEFLLYEIIKYISYNIAIITFWNFWYEFKISE